MNLPSDKVGHIIAGAVVSGSVCAIGLILEWRPYTCVIAGSFSALMLGFWKEIYDQFHPKNHTVDKWDAAATFFGGMLGAALFALWRWATLLSVFLLSCGLASCISRTTAETGTVQGQLSGQPVSIQWQRDSEGHTSITVPPIVTSAAGFLPSPWGELATGFLTLIAGSGIAAARANGKRADEHKADADEGWARATRPVNQAFTRTDGGA